MQIGRVHSSARPHGRRADLARRALLRHLLAPPERADRLHRPARSTTTSPTWSWPSWSTWSRRTRTRTSSVYVNSPGGSLHAGPRHLRHDPVHPSRRSDHLLRDGDVGRLADPRRRHRGQAAHAAERAHPDPPAVVRLPGPVVRHRDPRPRGARAAPAAGGDLRAPHRPDAATRCTRTWSATASSARRRRWTTAWWTGS